MTVQTQLHPSKSRFQLPILGHKFSALFSFKNLALAAALLVLGIVIYFAVGWGWIATWGATPQEVRATLPGDALVPAIERQTTNAVTIHAPPDKIYPWLLQLGVERGGMYSYDWLENLFGLNVHTINFIDPKYQNVKVGDFWGFTPHDYFVKEGPGIYVMQLEPNRAVIGCMSTANLVPPPCTSTFQLVLQPQADGTTRLILRSRTGADSPMSGAFGKAFDAIAFIMQRGMLLGFRERIEASR